MYESHFGLKGPPFQLSPDPSFYFGSKGHSHALAYLRFGAYQGEGFIVVTGEVGAGKTTLVRTLLSELDTERVVAAQVVSTQLEAGDLLRSILAAFGIGSAGLTKAQLIASLEAFLTLLATRSQRALLIIDEAQNLNLEAVEELRMLSNFQFDQHALLQSFLVGQPELRRLLQSRSMEQLRQRVIASCHLGPMDVAETRAYIEHRLIRVGWADRPRLVSGAFEAIHAATGGIPRRINVICNRLLLACYLSESEEITPETVRTVADDLRLEVGDPVLAPALAVATSGVSSSASPEAAPAVEPLASAQVIQLHRSPSSRPAHPLVMVADGALDYLKARWLAASLEASGAAQAVVIVAGEQAEVAGEEQSLGTLERPAMEVFLGVARSRGAQALATALQRFDTQFEELNPAAVAVLGSGDAALAAVLAARRRGMRVLRLDGGEGRRGNAPDAAPLVELMADMVFTRRTQAHYALQRAAIPVDRIRCIGSLLCAALDQSRAALPEAESVVKRAGLPASLLSSPRRFGVLALCGPAPLAATLKQLFDKLGDRLPLVWFVEAETAEAIRREALGPLLQRHAVALLPAPRLFDAVALLSRAMLVIGDDDEAYSEHAESAGVPYIVLAPGGVNAAEVAKSARDIVTAGADRGVSRRVGEAAGAIAEAVADWLSGDDRRPGNDPRACRPSGAA